MVLGTRDGVASPHPHFFSSSPDDQHEAFLKQLVELGLGWGVTLQTWAVPMTPTF